MSKGVDFRKFLVIFISLILMLNVTGCGGNDTSSVDIKEKTESVKEKESEKKEINETEENISTEKITEKIEEVKVDYQDAESFEEALKSGKNLIDKIVKFKVREVKTDTSAGYNIWAGKHLNFYSYNNPNAVAEEELIVKITFVQEDSSYEDGESRWLINYCKVGEEETISSKEVLAKHSGVYRWVCEYNEQAGKIINHYKKYGRTVCLELFDDGTYKWSTTYNNYVVEGKWNVERIEIQGKYYLSGFKNDVFTIYDMGEKLKCTIEGQDLLIDQFEKTTYDEIENIKKALPSVEVPNFNKYTIKEAKKWCKKNGIKCIIEEEYSDTVEYGKMIEQSKVAGVKIITLEALEPEITLKYSLGREPIKYESGTYKVGKDIDPGEYILFADDAYSASVYISSDANFTFKNTIYSDYFGNNQIVTVKKGDYIKIEDCYMYSFEAAVKGGIDGESVEELMAYRIEEGAMYKVGVNLKPGEYKLECTDDSGSWTIYKNIRKRFGNEFDYFEGSAYVKVEKGDYLLLDDCVIVTE